MKLLFDQNLSYRLPKNLTDRFPDSAHVKLLGMDRAKDPLIIEYARSNDFVIVTQDSDYVDRSKLFGAPPKIVWLRCGNSTPRYIESLLRENAVAILELSRLDSPAYIEIF